MPDIVEGDIKRCISVDQKTTRIKEAGITERSISDLDAEIATDWPNVFCQIQPKKRFGKVGIPQRAEKETKKNNRVSFEFCSCLSIVSALFEIHE